MHCVEISYNKYYMVSVYRAREEKLKKELEDASAAKVPLVHAGQ